VLKSGIKLTTSIINSEKEITEILIDLVLRLGSRMKLRVFIESLFRWKFLFIWPFYLCIAPGDLF
jgi:hypothetical protein